jgi:hypothetical protein
MSLQVTALITAATGLTISHDLNTLAGPPSTGLDTVAFRHVARQDHPCFLPVLPAVRCYKITSCPCGPSHRLKSLLTSSSVVNGFSARLSLM